MKWLGLVVCLLLSGYFALCSIFSAWVSATPVKDVEHHEMLARLTFGLSILFVVAGIGLFLWLHKKSRSKHGHSHQDR